MFILCTLHPKNFLYLWMEMFRFSPLFWSYNDVIFVLPPHSCLSSATSNTVKSLYSGVCLFARGRNATSCHLWILLCYLSHHEAICGHSTAILHSHSTAMICLSLTSLIPKDQFVICWVFQEPNPCKLTISSKNTRFLLWCWGIMIRGIWKLFLLRSESIVFCKMLILPFPLK